MRKESTSIVHKIKFMGLCFPLKMKVLLYFAHLCVVFTGTNFTNNLFMENRAYVGPHLSFLVFWRYRQADLGHNLLNVLGEN
jgi:hypothetical protein